MRTTVLLAILVSMLGSPASAYFSTIDNGEMVAPGQYQIGLEPQLIFNKYEGFNVVTRVDTGINESSSVRGILGFGKVDFQLGGMYKYVPFPDVDKQPAVGGDIGAILARVNGETEFSLRFHPLISKRFETEIGDLIPYSSLPLGLTFRPNKTVVPVQVAVGTELRPLNMSNFSFFAELGLNINEAFSYISAAVAWRFDEVSVKSSKGGKKK